MMRGGTLLILGHGIKGQGQLCHCVQDLAGRIQPPDFALSLSNFICALWIMRGRTVLILGHGSKVKVNYGTLCIRHYGQDTDCSFCPITFKLYTEVMNDERRSPIYFRSRSTLVLCIRPFWHNTDYSLFPMTFKLQMKYRWMWRKTNHQPIKLHMQVVDDERRNRFDFGSWIKGQGQLWHSVYKTLWTGYRQQFLSNHFQTSHEISLNMT